MITIVDYGMGNLRSLANAFKFLGEKVEFAKTTSEILGAKKLVFPGVGNFGEAMKRLRAKKLDHAIVQSVSRGTPFLGVCLGLQLLFEKSEEDPRSRGLGILKGKVLKFRGVKIPHMGWNEIVKQKDAALLAGIQNGSFAYFMHSFYVKPEETGIVVATTPYGNKYCSSIQVGNIFGVQFHPEKSGLTGLQILKSFLQY